MKAPRTTNHVTDYDDAYANAPYIPDADSFADNWSRLAGKFRTDTKSRLDIVYGSAPRQQFDLFLPTDTPKGLIVFIHGGYWMAFDKSSWSHLANGGVQAGYGVAIPSYTLCPQARISEITQQVAQAITTASEMIDGPVQLCGHSAGGHLVSRMISHTSPLQGDVLSRIKNVISISGIHDLRPLLSTSMNDTLHLDEAEAERESPALLQTAANTTASLTCWVGANERPEFIRQNTLLRHAQIVEEPGKHHFNVIEGLCDPDHGLIKALLSG